MKRKGFHHGRIRSPAVGAKRYRQHRDEAMQAWHRQPQKVAAPDTIHFPSKPCHVRAAVKSPGQNRKRCNVKRAKTSRCRRCRAFFVGLCIAIEKLKPTCWSQRTKPAGCQPAAQPFFSRAKSRTKPVLLSVKVLFSCANFSARRAHGFFIRKPGNQEFSKKILVSWFPYDFRLRLRRAVLK